jgi:F0F1-type ATP synthase assembly protein I
MSTSEPRDKVRPLALDLGRFAGLGLQFVLTVAVFGGLGWWLDTLLATSPWLLVAGVLAGGVVAFVLIVRSVPPAGPRAGPPAGRGRDADPPAPPRP